jgi:hypothetical protein
MFAERNHHIASCPPIETVKRPQRFFAARIRHFSSSRLWQHVQKAMTQRDRTARFRYALLHYCNTSPVMKMKSGIISAPRL